MNTALTDNDIIETISELNQEIYDTLQDGSILFEASFTGTTAVVLFLGNRIWFEDEDERELDATKVLYEPLIDFLRRTAAKEIQRIQVLATLWQNHPQGPQGTLQ